MEFGKKNFVLIILILFFSEISHGFTENVSVNISVNNNISEKIINESVQNVENKTLSIFKDIKSIRYDYKLYDKSDYGDILKTTNDFDVSIVSKNKNSSIALAYYPKCFVIYNNVFLKIYNRNNNNLSLWITINNNTLKKYNISENYAMYRFDFNDNVNKLRIQVFDGNDTIYDTGPLTVIHQNYIDWHEEQKKKYEHIEVGQLILSKIIYFISGGILALVLAVIIARREKKKKESEILAGWQ